MKIRLLFSFDSLQLNCLQQNDGILDKTILLIKICKKILLVGMQEENGRCKHTSAFCWTYGTSAVCKSRQPEVLHYW